MKKVLLLMGILVSMTAARVVFGQTAEGVITYEAKINMHRTLPKDQEGMKHMVPEFRTSKEQLVFNAQESLYKLAEEEEEEEDIDDGQGVRMRFRTPRNEIYVRPADSKRILLQEFMGKKYLIEDTLKMTAWKLGAETKEILGYTCKQATFYNAEREQEITAWYTDKLRPFLGPESFNTLPGTVLLVDINNGERTITALHVDARTLKKNEMKIPAEGTKTTQAEFRKMVDQQRERMRANGANVIIRN